MQKTLTNVWARLASARPTTATSNHKCDQNLHIVLSLLLLGNKVQLRSFFMHFNVKCVHCG